MKYNLYQRTVNGKKRWYYWYYGERGQQVRKSCGVRVSSRYEAEQVIRTIEARGETFASYALGFFDHDSDFIIRLKAKGRMWRESTRGEHKRNTDKYLLPLFGHIPIKALSADLAEGELLKITHLRNSSKNRVLVTLSMIMKQAARKGIISNPPVFEPFANDSVRKDTLTMQELSTLFPEDLQGFIALWGKYVVIGTMCAVATSCGLRSGEVRGLERSHVDFNYGALLVNQALDQQNKIVKPKSSTSKVTRSRVVPIPTRTQKYLKYYLSTREDSIKWLFVKEGLPIRSLYLLLSFKRIIAKHLDVEGRTLDIHSLRYTYNTIMSSRLSHDLLRKWIGHKSESMTQHYYSPSLEDEKKEIIHHRGVVDSFFTS